MNDFLDRLQSFLDGIDAISADDIHKAIGLIRTRRKIILTSEKKLTTAGPCWICGKIIQYSISRIHIQRGDKWYNKFIQTRKSNDPITFTVKGDAVHVHEYSTQSALGYMCEPCLKFFLRAVDEHKNKIREHNRILSESAEIRQIETENGIITGRIKASIQKRFNVICQTANEIYTPERIRGLTYRDFLQSYYWDAVRKYKLYRAHFKCELCNTGGQLQVHHKTYEHHGEEHANLDDLIVLCDNCHAKFHDKLPKQEVENERHH